MKKSNLASTLKSLLDRKNLSESELARRTGIGQPVIHRMASGETDNPKIETLRPIARFFDISLEQLLGDAPINLDQPPVFKVEQEHFNLPLITLDLATLWPKNKDPDITYPFVLTNLKLSESAYAIRLKGSTMYPMFPDGTLLIIEPNHQPKHKDFVIVKLENHAQAVFKQLLIDGNTYYLKSVSKDYQPHRLKPADTILGVMLQARIDYRSN